MRETTWCGKGAKGGANSTKQKEKYKPIETLTEFSSLSSVWYNKSPGLTQNQIISLFALYKQKVHLLAILPGCICRGDIEMMCFISAWNQNYYHEQKGGQNVQIMELLQSR